MASELVSHKFENGVLHYEIKNAGVASLDLNSIPDNVKQYLLEFGAKTITRNATAGFLEEDPAKALARINARFKAFNEGIVKADAGSEGAESQTSQLARALAQASGMEPSEAAKVIEENIKSNVEAAGLSSDEDGDKPKIRKIATAVRKGIEEIPEVGEILAQIRAEEAAKRAAVAKEAAAKAKESGTAPTLAGLLGR